MYTNQQQQQLPPQQQYKYNSKEKQKNKYHIPYKKREVRPGTANG